MSVQERGQQGVVAAIETLCSRSPNGLAIRNVQVLALDEAVTFGESFLSSLAGQATGERTFRVDALQLVDLDSSRGAVHLILPWSGADQMPHELWSVVEWHLPWAVALKQDYGGLLRRWVWEDGPRAASGALSSALTALGKAMYGDVPVAKSAADATIEIEWAVQAVPLDKARYVFAAQSAPRLLGPAFDLDGYLGKRARFEQSLADLSLGGAATFGFLVPCHTDLFVKQAFPQVVQRKVDGRIVALLETARRLLESGKFPQAARSAEDALSIAPGNTDAEALRDLAKSRQAEAEGLAKEAKDAVRRKDFDAAAAANQRLLVLHTGDKSKAREIKTALDQVDAERVRHHFQQAQLLAKQGKGAEAADHLRKLLEIKPNHQMARQLLTSLGG